MSQESNEEMRARVTTQLTPVLRDAARAKRQGDDDTYASLVEVAREIVGGGFNGEKIAEWLDGYEPDGEHENHTEDDVAQNILMVLGLG